MLGERVVFVRNEAHSSRDREKGKILLNRRQRNTRAMFQRMAESMNLDFLKHILPFDSFREPSFGPIVADGLGDRDGFDSREKIVGPLGPPQKNLSKV